MYAKVFSSMYHGSLATVGPWEALVTFQQFLILADRLGVVDMTAEVIARISTIPLDIIRKGIEVLEQPDPASRNPNEHGARIKRLSEHRDWGWIIVNHAHYRAIRSAEERRDYMRTKMRESRAQEAQKPLPPNFDVFWAACPRKVGKGSAEKVWRKLNPDEALTMQIVKAMTEQRACDQWMRDGGKFIPHPATWLNRKGWEDEIALTTPADGKIACRGCGTRVSEHTDRMCRPCYEKR